MWYKTQLFLDKALESNWKSKEIFSHVFNLQGQVFRMQKNRKTLRFEIEGEGFFIKLHRGIGWLEIIKNWSCLRAPVWGAQQEMKAIQRLQQLEIPTTPLMGFGQQGFNPAKLQSFLITREITSVISLEDFCRPWLQQPPLLSIKRALISEVARIARLLHSNGVNHRDFYICHFLLDTSRGLNLRAENLKLYLIDLHRVQLRSKTPLRWIIKDIAGLYFSSMDIGLTRHDLFYFLRIYFNKPLSKILKSEQQFLQRVQTRAMKLYGKEKKKQFSAAMAQEQITNISLMLTGFQPPIICEQVLQFIPGKVFVARTRWGKQWVVAKLYENYHLAAQEMEGYELLRKNKVATPALLYSGWAQGKTIYVLLFEFIDSACDARAIWSQLDVAKRENLLHNLLTLEAKLHNMGLKQRQLSLNDFLLSKQNIYILNPAKILKDSYPVALAPQISLKNLAMLFAELPISFKEKYADFYHYYCQCRQMVYTLDHLYKFKKWINQINRHRIYPSNQNLFVTNNEFICKKTWHSFWVCNRAYDTSAMRMLLEDPETIIEGPAAKVLKSCATTSVIQITINERILVVKRYNIKGFWHGLKRAFRSTRASISWRSAHLFNAAKIQTPKPVAILEKRFGPLRSTSYFISEYVRGTSLQTFFAESNSLEEKMFVGDKMIDVFNKLDDIKTSHGDFKSTNILLVGSQPVLLDLDAVCFHRCDWRWRKANRNDRQRFLKNWQDNPEVREMFKTLV